MEDTRTCAVCGASIAGRRCDTVYCSVECRKKAKSKRQRKHRLDEANGGPTTYRTYQYISGHWDKYFAKILRTKRYHHKNTGVAVDITPEDVIEVLKSQDYRCALSGVPLTCRLTSGVIYHTNASIDRINAGEDYTKSNIQLVAAALNNFRGNLSVEEFVAWCISVAQHHK